MPAGVFDFVVGPDEMPRILELIQQAQGRVEFIEPVPEREPTGSTFVDEFDMEYEVNNYHPDFGAHLLEQRREHGPDLDADVVLEETREMASDEFRSGMHAIHYLFNSRRGDDEPSVSSWESTFETTCRPNDVLWDKTLCCRCSKPLPPKLSSMMAGPDALFNQI